MELRRAAGARSWMTAGLVGLCLGAFSCGSGTLSNGPETTPTATPTSQPTEPPSKTPQPVGSVICSIGPGDENATCSRRPSKIFDTLDATIEDVLKAKPEIFDATQQSKPGTGSYRVLDKQALLAEVLDRLRSQGFCADLDYTDLETIHVKSTNDYSERFKVYEETPQGGFLVRGFLNSYVTSCTPSDFPVEADPNGPPPGSGCGRPYPPPLGRFGSKVHTHGPEYSTLDSTPLIVSCGYCELIGFTDGRCICPVRLEGAPDRVACENWRTGIAKDTGRPGPTWTKEDGSYCRDPKIDGCEADPNPYALRVYDTGAGLYRVCSASGVCSEVIADR